MKKISFSFFLVISVLAIMGFAKEDEQFLDWSSARRLTWSDYLANPATESDAAAITSTALGMEYHVRNNKLTFKVTCRFSKTRSWVKHKTEHILGHEQGHFDITEIFARKLTKAIKEYKFNPRTYQADMNKIYKKIMEEKEEYQNEYDEGTDFSRKKSRQAEWLEKIGEELAELEEFADYN